MTRVRPVFTGRNGLPESGGYVYRGKQRLDDTNSYECEGGCGRRLENKPGPRMGSCAVCRDSSGLTFGPGGGTPRPASERAR